MNPRRPSAAFRAAWSRLTTTLAPARDRRRVDDELREELEAHLAMHIADNVRRGMSPAEARRDALLAAGGLTQGMERVRERRGLRWLEQTAADLRGALRAVVARPSYASAVIVTLALGIGANTAMFTVVNAVVLHPLPYPEPDRLLSLSQSVGGEDQGVVDERAYFAWSPARSVAIAVESSTNGILATEGGAREVTGDAVTSGYFDVFGVRPLLGRTFRSDEHAAGAARVAVVSEQLWRQALGADSSIVGRTISLDDVPTTVIGVMPASFTTSNGPAYWIPQRIVASPPNTTYYYRVVGRLRDGFDLRSVRAELAALAPPPAPSAAPRPPGPDGVAPEGRAAPVVMTLGDRRFGERRTPVLLLLGAVGVLLLIACANLATLALVRAAEKEREFAVRIALGASRWRLMRALLTESLVFAFAGAALGLTLAALLVALFVHLSPDSVGNPERLRLDRVVLLFTSAVAIASALASGIAPALAAGRSDPQRALSSGTPRASAGVARQLARRVLVVWQLATALVLLTGAGLVARSFWRATEIPTGFRPYGLIDVAVRLPAKYPDAELAPFYAQILARVRAIPTVRDAALADAPPLGGIMGTYSTRDSAGHDSPLTAQISVGRDYFRTVGARLVAGRGFDATDRDGAPPVVVVNALLARRLYPAGHAVGKTMAGPRGTSVIVGVVGNILQRSLESAPSPLVYTNLAQPGQWTRILVRAEGDPSVTERAIAQIVHSADPRLPPPAFERLDDVVARALAPRAFLAMPLGAFAALAVLLAAVGLYGVLSQTVSGRAREIAIRVALGAEPRRLLAAVLVQGLALVTAGALIGLGVSLASVRVMRSLLYETSVYDPWAMVTTTVLLVAVAVLASYVPARRATRIDPITVLREE